MNSWVYNTKGTVFIRIIITGYSSLKTMDEDRLLTASLKEEESYEDEDVNLDRGDNTEKAIEHYTSEQIKRAVEDIEHTPSATLDLSRKGLQHVDDLFNISRIENLYLEGNEISSLPDHFFSEMANLVWLDLRNNKISCLPPGIGRHRCLNTLLLEGNPIKELPIELGNLITLRALSLRQCPIEFPPEDIVHQGLQAILKFLRSTMAGKPIYTRNSCQDLRGLLYLDTGLASKLQNEACAIFRNYRRQIDKHPSPRKAVSELWKQTKMPPIEKLKLTDLVKSSLELSEEWPNDEEMKRFEKLRKEMMQADEADMGDTDQSFQLVPSIDRAVLTSKGARKTIIARLPKRKQVPLKYTFPELPPYYNQSRTTAQERRLLALKDLKEKQALIEQRRKDQELLKEWREHSKCMQEKGEMEFRQGGTALAKSDENVEDVLPRYFEIKRRVRQALPSMPAISFSDRSWCIKFAEKVIQKPVFISDSHPEVVLKNTPYATDPDFYRMLDSRECIKQGSHEEHVRVKKLLTRKSFKEIEDARAARDRELEYRIRAHIQMMQERRRKSKGTVQEEIDATRTEMEAAQKLQSEVVQRKLERDVPLEYRFTAFTGEQSS